MPPPTYATVSMYRRRPRRDVSSICGRQRSRRCVRTECKEGHGMQTRRRRRVWVDGPQPVPAGSHLSFSPSHLSSLAHSLTLVNTKKKKLSEIPPLVSARGIVHSRRRISFACPMRARIHNTTHARAKGYIPPPVARRRSRH